jgi:hypothetical protein
MHVMTISTVSDGDRFWDAMKKVHGQLPKGAKWVFAVASVDGTKAVNVIVHDSVGSVRELVEAQTGAFAESEYVEADAANAVGLLKK